MADELFSWGKFFKGIVSPIGYFKTIADIVRLIVILLLIFFAYCLGVKIHNWLSPKKQAPITFTVSEQTGGEVRNSADQKHNNFGVINF